MRLPKTARPPGTDLPEVYLGKGDYAAGGARSVPFLDLDCARRRRPLVLGEVTDSLEGYPELASEMFSGRQADPAEWAVMWKELGADGVCLRISEEDPEKAVSLVKSVSDRTRLPLAVDASPDVLKHVASAVDDTVLMLIADSHIGCGHVVVRRFADAEQAASALADAGDGTMVSFEPRALGDGIESFCGVMEEYRARGLAGERACRFPMVADLTCTWNLDRAAEDSSARRVSLWEASGALSAMLAGADIVIVRGPGAADMARVYGEELADL